MKLTNKTGITIYLVSDYFMAMIAWGVMFVFRKTFIGGYRLGPDNNWIFDDKFYYGILLIPLFWILVYFIMGTYRFFFRKSRLTELYKTFIASVFGVTILFYVLILDDQIDDNYINYYRTIGVLFTLHFLLTAISRLVILNRARRLVNKGIVGYNTIIIGGNERAVKLYQEITSNRRARGYKFIGFVDTNGNSENGLGTYLPRLGDRNQLEQVIGQNQIEEVIIAVESSEHPQLSQIITALAGQNVIIKIIPDMYDILSGSVKMTDVVGAPLIEIYPEIIPFWQKIVKRILDIVVSAAMLILLSPLYLLIALRVRLSSSGPIFYTQQRIGYQGKPFKMYKFRSMYVNSEQDGPKLSSENDKRITPWGRTMRKWRFDELPQFYNILIGDMSLVGPRPERKYFIEKIIKHDPTYRHLQKVKPGLTSWGMVKFGYAENVEQMLERMQYDLLYIENMSLAVDFKIMIYTVLVILQGRGK